MNSIHLPDSLSSHVRSNHSHSHSPRNTGPVKVHIVREMDLVYDGQMQVELGHLDLQVGCACTFRITTSDAYPRRNRTRLSHSGFLGGRRGMFM
jgi:hypothetical protein